MRSIGRRFLRIWRVGLKSVYKYLFYLLITAFVGAYCNTPLQASGHYKKILKRWTRHGTAFVVANLEAQLDWDATYLSDEFREASLDKMAPLLAMTPTEVAAERRENQAQEGRYDEFFIGAYAGSSDWPGMGKNTGDWSIVLEAADGDAVKPVRFERVTITQREKILYPYLDRWDQAYRITFPKTIHAGEKFTLRMTGIPAKSALVWR